MKKQNEDNEREMCSQLRVDSLFIPFKQKNTELNDKIEQIEFLFKNSVYNLNRLKEETAVLNGGFSFPDCPWSFEMQIPVTVWADIMVFEFQACLYNIVRTLNFLTMFNLKEINKIHLKRGISMSHYIDNPKYQDTIGVDYFKEAYENWVREINKTRNEFTHENLFKKIEGYMIMKRKKDQESVQNEGRFAVGIREHRVDDFELYLEEKINLLENFILNYFNHLNSLKQSSPKFSK